MVTALFVKAAKLAAMTPVRSARFDERGFIGQVLCPPLRQVLLLPSAVHSAYNIRLGDLRENVVVDMDDLHDHPSGTTLHVGEAKIQLTFHCEPCGRISNIVPIKLIRHNRGYLGRFLNSGAIRVGDRVRVGARENEPIPHELLERLEWFLLRQTTDVPVKILLWEIGLSNSYARAIPGLLKRLSPELRRKVVFTSRSTALVSGANALLTD